MKYYGFLSVVAVLILGLSFSMRAQAQEKQNPTANDVSKVQDKTRARRVAAGQSPAAKSPEPTTEEQSGDEKANDEAVAGPASQPLEVTALRDQIASATNPQEKVRLQFRLVEALTSDNKTEAVKVLREMAAEERFDPTSFYNIGNSLARLGDAEGAINSYRKAIEQRKENYSRALNNLGVVFLLEGRWDEAYEVLTAALRIENFRYAEASYNLGRLYAARGQTDLAAREWRRALAVNPKHSGATKALAGTTTLDRISVVALTKSKNALPAPKVEKPQRLVTPAPAVAPALSSAKPASSVFAVDPVTYTILQRARLARDQNRDEEAIANYQRVLARMDGYFAPANVELSYALMTLKRNDEALTALLPVAERDSARFPICFYHLGRLYELKGDLKTAETYYQRATDSYKDGKIRFLLDITRVREKAGDVKAALVSLEQYIQEMEALKRRPDWADERLAAMRQKAATLP